MAIFNIATAAQLQMALGQASGGDTIILAAGNYGSLNLNNRKYSSNVTIVSADKTSMAHFDGITVSNSSNLTFSSLDLGRGLSAGEPEYTKINTVQNSSGIRVVDNFIHGSLDGDPTNDGIGLYVTDSSDVAVSGNTLDEFFRGVLIQRVSNIGIYDNTLQHMRSDGIDVAGTDHITISGNTFQSFLRTGTDHADAIQFWNAAQTKGNSDILIQNNVFLQQDAGAGAQGIFIYDNLLDFTNVTIHNNLMYGNDDYNGITVNRGINVNVTDNTVLSTSTDSMVFWIRLESSQNVVASGNIADRYVFGKDLVNFQSSNNIDLTKSPELKALFANLDNPTSIWDLITPGAGYQPLVTGAISSEIGHSMSAMLSAKTALIPSAPIVADDDAFALSQTLSMAAAPALAEPLHAFALADSGGNFLSKWTLFDHFTALP